ncbi:uncharacterized protein LOC125236019 [Leguminivora glycinivorella]|uniref:uncharacterized protein LOC125236019 n=1 Tax=Leguminivora glycinivorella TaxID=1035111 RepID=UPI00200D0987|nr:uncharacterized protein LOC125236019 [Leguminivora glycinivorella]
MGILKVLPLMYLLATTSAWLPENYENCLCPTESPTIINSLDTDRSGVERLVVFVYKKPDTGEIVSFIPQKEHQRKIPDFPIRTVEFTILIRFSPLEKYLTSVPVKI